jgi:hypothetical protein
MKLFREEVYEGAQTEGDLTFDALRLKVGEGPYAGSWRLRVHAGKHLPAALEYLDGLPPFLLEMQTTVFAASQWNRAPPGSRSRKTSPDSSRPTCPRRRLHGRPGGTCRPMRI